MDPTCTWILGESGDVIAPGVQVFRRPEGGAPCEITLQTPRAASAQGVLEVVSNARLCELYVRSPGEIAASYACTLRGEPYPATIDVFNATYQGALRPGCTLTLRMLSLTPFKDELRLHSIAWGPPEGKSAVQAAALAAAAAAGAEEEEGSLSRGSRELELPAWDRERGSPGEQLLQEEEGEEEEGPQTELEQQQAGQQQQRRQQQGEQAAQMEGGCSQMDEIRSMLRSAALQGGDDGDPKRALMAALARSALSQGRPASAAPFLGGVDAGQPPWAPLMQAAMQAVAQPSDQPADARTAAHLAPPVPPYLSGGAAAAPGTSLQVAAAPAASGKALSSGPPAKSGMQAPAAPTAAAAAAAAAAAGTAPVGPEDLAAVQRWLSRELGSLEQVIAERLEARLDRLDVSLLSCSAVGGLGGAGPGRCKGASTDSSGERSQGVGSRQDCEQQQLREEECIADLAGGSTKLLLDRQTGLERRMGRLEERMAGLERLGEEIKIMLRQLVPT